MEFEDFEVITGCCSGDADKVTKLLSRLSCSWRTPNASCGDKNLEGLLPQLPVIRATRLALQDACRRECGNLSNSHGHYANSLRELIRVVAPAVVSPLNKPHNSNAVPASSSKSGELSPPPLGFLPQACRDGI